MSFAVVVAADAAGGIGKEGALPWHLPGDLAFFRRITRETRVPARRNAVVMGRKTWETIPQRLRPLAGRLNAVVTRQRSYSVPAGVIMAPSLRWALAEVGREAGVERTFVIGGGAIYVLALALDDCREVYLTRIDGDFDCDTFFPALGDDFDCAEQSERHQENGVGYRFERWERKEPPQGA